MEVRQSSTAESSQAPYGSIVKTRIPETSRSNSFPNSGHRGTLANSSSRPSSIPRLIPVTLTKDKREIMYRDIIAKTNAKHVSKYPDKLNKFRLTRTPKKTLPPMEVGRDCSSKAWPNRISYLKRKPALASELMEQGRSEVSLQPRQIMAQQITDQVIAFFKSRGQKLSAEGPAQTESIQETVQPYVHEILELELERAKEFIPSRTELFEKQRDKRKQMVCWILGTGRPYCSTETLHLAVYILDRFLETEWIGQRFMELTAGAALWIAVKQEEVETESTIGLSYLLQIFDPVNRIDRWRLVRMEARILSKLNFKVFAPTANFFMEMCANQIQFPDESIKSYILKLGSAILFDNLCDFESVFVSLKDKTVLALTIASNFVMWNLDPIRENDMSGAEDAWMASVLKVCMPEFKHKITKFSAQVVTNHPCSKRIRTSRSLVDITNRKELPGSYWTPKGQRILSKSTSRISIA